MYQLVAQWLSSSVRLEIEGLLAQDSPEALCCVLEQDTLSSAIVLVQPRKKEQLLSWT